jgi:membrane-associated phospholipid phosphatase
MSHEGVGWDQASDYAGITRAPQVVEVMQMVISTTPFSVPLARPPPCSHRLAVSQPPASIPDLRDATWASGHADWWSQLTQRARRFLWLKTIGISLWIWVFMVAYFHLLRHPTQVPFTMPLTALDLLVPFQPGAFAAYVSLWVYVGLPPGLLLGFRELLAYGLWVAAMCLSGLAVFLYLPTTVPVFALDPALVNDPAFALLQGVDAAGNACPSMHVASAMFSVVWLHHLLRVVGAPRLLEALNLGWFMLIVYSTLAVRQHVVLDVLAGAALGALFAWASLRWRPSTPRLRGEQLSSRGIDKQTTPSEDC